jgi:hypothetical protein
MAKKSRSGSKKTTKSKPKIKRGKSLVGKARKGGGRKTPSKQKTPSYINARKEKSRKIPQLRVNEGTEKAFNILNNPVLRGPETSKATACNGVWEAIHLMRGQPNVDVISEQLENLGWTVGEIMHQFNKSDGAKGLYEALRKECMAYKPKFNKQKLTNLLIDTTSVREKTLNDNAKLLESVLSNKAGANGNIDSLKIAAKNVFRRINTDKRKFLVDTDVNRMDSERQRLIDKRKLLQKQLDDRKAEALKIAAENDLDETKAVVNFTGETAKELQQANRTLLQLGLEVEKAKKQQQKLALRAAHDRERLYLDKKELDCLFKKAYQVPSGNGESIDDLDMKIFHYDATDGRPTHVIVEKDNMGPVFKETFAITKLLENMWANNRKCAEVLARHDIERKAGWDALVNYLQEPIPEDMSEDEKQKEQKLRKAIIADMSPCLYDALHATKTMMFDKMDKYLDQNGFVTVDDDMNAEWEDEFDDDDKVLAEKFKGLNVNIPVFREITESDEAKKAFENWMKHLLSRDVASEIATYQQTREDMQWFGSQGTGFGTGDVPLLPAPLNDLSQEVRKFASDGAKEQLGKSVAKALKDAYVTMQGVNNIKGLYRHLSPTARQILELRLRISQNVCREMSTLTKNEVCKVTLKEFKESLSSSYGNSRERKRNENQAGTVAKYNKLKNEVRKQTRGLLGENSSLPETKYVSAEAKSVFESLQGVIATQLKDDDSQQAEERKADKNHYIWAFIRALDSIFGVTMDCEKLSQLPRNQRKPAFENYINDIVPSIGEFMKNGQCKISAYSLDMVVMDPSMDSVRKELEPFAPLTLVDALLLQMGLPCASDLLTNGKQTCQQLKRLVLSNFEPKFAGITEATRRIQEGLKDTFDIYSLAEDIELSVREDRTANFAKFASVCLEAAQVWRYIRYTFESSTEYSGEDLFRQYQLHRYTATSKVMYNQSIQSGSKGYNKLEGNLKFLITVTDDNEKTFVGNESNLDKIENTISEYSTFVKEWAKNVHKIGAEPNVNMGLDDDIDMLTSMPHQMNKNLIPLVISPTVLKSASLQLGRINPQVYCLDDIFVSDLKNDGESKNVEKENPMVLSTLKKAIFAMIGMEGVMDENENLLPLGEEVEAKQMRIITKQAESLCMLPKDQCKGRCVYVDNKCLVAGKQHLKDNRVMWNDTVKFSKTRPKQLGTGLEQNHDVWYIGYDTLSEELIESKNDEGNEFNEKVKKYYGQIRAINALDAFISTISAHPNPLKQPNGLEMFNRIINKIRARRKVMEKIMVYHKCNEVYKLIQEMCTWVEKVLNNVGKLDREEEAVETETQTIAFDLEKFLERMTNEPDSDSVEKSGLGLPKAKAVEKLCQLIQAILSHYNEINFVRCDLNNAAECEKASKFGAPCQWKWKRCYNPLLHSLKPTIGGGEVLGLVHKELLDDYVQILAKPQLYQSDQHYGIRQLMGALYGDEFVQTFAFMEPTEAIKKLRQVVDRRFKSCNRTEGVQIPQVLLEDKEPIEGRPKPAPRRPTPRPRFPPQKDIDEAIKEIRTWNVEDMEDDDLEEAYQKLGNSDEFETALKALPPDMQNEMKRKKAEVMTEHNRRKRPEPNKYESIGEQETIVRQGKMAEKRRAEAILSAEINDAQRKLERDTEETEQLIDDTRNMSRRLDDNARQKFRELEDRLLEEINNENVAKCKELAKEAPLNEKKECEALLKKHDEVVKKLENQIEMIKQFMQG